MKYNIPMKTAGEFSLPALGFGTYQMGGPWMERDPNNDDQKDVNAIKLAIMSGLTHIDTAEGYADGHCETLVGEAIKEFDRSQLFITTKVQPSKFQYDTVISSAKASLDRMHIQQMDLFLLHGPSDSIAIKEAIKALDFLIDNELTRYIGVSNFDKELIEQAQSYTKNKIVNNQIHYNLWAREHEQIGTLEYCEQNQILVTAYRPIGKTGELARSQNELLHEIAKKYNKTTAQVAINWVMCKPNIVTLFKTSSAQHFEENMGAVGWTLEKEDEKLLDKEFPRGETTNVGLEGWERSKSNDETL